MKPNRIQKMGLAVLGFLAFSMLASTLHAQSNGPQESSVQNNSTGGCTNADGLIDQASDLISQLQNIKPADFSAAADSANPKKMVDTLLGSDRRSSNGFGWEVVGYGSSAHVRPASFRSRSQYRRSAVSLAEIDKAASMTERLTED